MNTTDTYQLDPNTTFSGAYLLGIDPVCRADDYIIIDSGWRCHIIPMLVSFDPTDVEHRRQCVNVHELVQDEACRYSGSDTHDVWHHSGAVQPPVSGARVFGQKPVDVL